MLFFSFTVAAKPEPPTFFDKWVINFEEPMNPDVVIIEMLKVQLSGADINTAKGEKMPDGSTTLILQLIFKVADPKKEESKMISATERTAKSGKLLSLNAFLFYFECMVMLRYGILSTSKMYVFLD